MLKFSEETRVDILKDFECGIQVMDEFIHTSLALFLDDNSKYTLHIATDNDLGIVAMYVTSYGVFVDHDGEFEDIPSGKPWGYLDDNFEMVSGTMCPTLEIDYLAVRKDLREKGYGTQIISELSNTAVLNGCLFLTVDAYHEDGYSAIPFYEKQGFFALQEFSEDTDTLRMAKRC